MDLHTIMYLISLLPEVLRTKPKAIGQAEQEVEHDLQHPILSSPIEERATKIYS